MSNIDQMKQNISNLQLDLNSKNFSITALKKANDELEDFDPLGGIKKHKNKNKYDKYFNSLLKKEISNNEKGNSLLSLAVQCNSMLIATTLLERGAKVNEPNNSTIHSSI